jgi:NADH-quinone oxidoreductase subunit L
MLEYAWLILLFPLAGVLINTLLGRWLSRRLVAIIASLAIAAAFVLAAVLFVEFLRLAPETGAAGDERGQITVPLFTWIVAGEFVVEAALLLDELSILMALVVTGVSALIHIYSAGYMDGDRYHNRYFTWLNLFVFMMLVLVTADGFVTMYIGWEGVGLCSYLLIGYWFEKEAAADAGKKAFIVNRVGDFGLALGIMLVFATFGSVAFQDVLPAAGTLLPGTATAIALLLFLGAIAKSAQIPLHIWLPDAMEGPTPVSALIHAATMVTAGVYLVVRCYAIFEASPSALIWVTWVGALTAFFAATVAVVQKDFKRILAYSTISQLGFMFVGAGVGAYVASVFHLVTHAFFKALLFLCAGSVMHALAGELDIIKMGGLRKKMPWTFGTHLVGTLALAGVPLFSGFFSKDMILLRSFEQGSFPLWLLEVLTAGLTAFYAFRLLFVAFYGQSRLDRKTDAQVHEAPWVMVVPMVILAVMAVVIGYIGLPEVLGLGSLIERLLQPVLADAHFGEPAASGAILEVALMLASVAAVSVGFLLSYWLYIRRWGLASRMTKNAQWLYDLVYNAYYVDAAYTEAIVKPLRALGRILSDVVETGVIDGAVNGLAWLVGLVGVGVRRLQTGLVRNYALVMLAGVVGVLAFLVVRSVFGW